MQMNFPVGSIYRTYNSLASNDENVDALTFNQLIEGHDWNRILLSSYCTDYEWLLEQFKDISPSTPIALISHYDCSDEPAGIKKLTAKTISGERGRTRDLFIINPPFPKFSNYGVMHCKLIILFAENVLRIVVSSANLIDYDYDAVQNVSLCNFQIP